MYEFWINPTVVTILYWLSLILLIAVFILSYLHTKYRQKVKELTTIDDSSGMKNPRATYAHLEYVFDTAKRYGQPLSLGVLKLKSLEQLRQKHGNKYVSDLITKVGKKLKKELRSTDLLGRIAFDEILITLTNTEHDSAQMVFKRLVHAVKRLNASNRPMKIDLGCSDINSETATMQTLVSECRIALKQIKINADVRLQYYIPVK